MKSSAPPLNYRKDFAMSNYPGIDYSGPGSTANRDPETGIRYGVISQHSIQPDVMSDIWSEARDLSYEAAKEDILDRIMASCASETQEERIENIIADIEGLYPSRSTDALDQIRFVAVEIEELGGDSAPDREDVWLVIEDRFNDTYEAGCDSNDWLWEKDGYRLSNCLQTDVFVSRSPYFTYAQFCSPCVPGAGNLDHPFEPPKVDELDWKTMPHLVAELARFPMVFCLGHDFFENEEAPYPVFSVATGKRVVMVEKKETCPSCKGGFREPDGSTCFRCGGLGYEIKKVQEEQ